MMTLVLILVAAAAGLGLARWRRLPEAPLLIVAGMLVSATGLLPEPRTLQDILLMGLTFLVFVVGSELDLRRVGDQRRLAVRVGLSQFLVLGGIGVGATLLVGLSPLAALYVGLALTATSTLTVVALLRRREQFFEPFGRMVIGVLLLQDVLVVVLLSALARADGGPWAVAQAVLATLVLLALTAVFLRWVAPLLLIRMELDEESTLLAVLAILFVFVGAAHWMALPMITGAFLAGVALSGFPVRGVIRGHVSSLADFFLAVFFVALGASVTLPAPRQLVLEGLLLFGLLLLSPPLVMLIARRAGLTVRASIEGAHLLTQCGEFSLIVGLVGVQQGHIGQNVLAVILLVAVVSMMISPFLAADTVTWRLMRWLARRTRERLPEDRPRDHVLLLGSGEHMHQILEQLVGRGLAVVVVDDDPTAVERAREAGALAIRGDGADFHVLRSVGAREARLIVSTMRRLEDHERLLRFVHGRQVLVRTFSPEEGERVRALGGEPVVEAEAAAKQFLTWFEGDATEDGSARQVGRLR